MKTLKEIINRQKSLKLANNISLFLLVVICLDHFLFPAPVLASINENEADFSQEEQILEEIINPVIEKEPEELVKIAWTSYHKVTAYNSEAAQTDASPCITANGFNLCEHGIEDTVAANFLKFGTKVRFPEVYGEKVFIVRDRMNKRYNDRMDIWMLEKQDAKNFGIKTLKVEILE